MNEETNQITRQVKENLIKSSKNLGRALFNSEAYQRYIRARDNFRLSEEAKKSSMEYNAVLRDYQMKANYGTLTPEDEKLIEEARQKAMSNEILKEFYESQQDLIAFYQEVNSYLSEKLKFNFASLAKPASGCCG
ncbi:YlbF family regulator [Melioribacter sp. OK-6-Me]|uniref:YlbF family regulator n=1 Tax=unclassified Melioribacter TaxID=2627329 RepID=UPI003ED92AC1